MEKETGDKLIFSAKMVDDDPDNKGRVFTIAFSLDNDEVKIYEKETNGFRGGFFYKSPHYRTPKKFDPTVPYIGAIIDINGTKFQLIDAPNSTLDLMESMPDDFDVSNLLSIVEKLHLAISKTELENKFLEADKQKINQITLSDAEEVLSSTNLNPHEIKTILRRYRFYNTNWFIYPDLISCY